METVTINVNDQNGAVAVHVQVFGSGGGIIGAGASPLVLSLVPGSWSVEVSRRVKNVSASNPYAITVADTGGTTPQTFTITVATLTITDPSRPPSVRLFGYLVGGDGRPIAVRVLVRTVGYGQRQPYVTPPGSPAPSIDPQVTAVLPEPREALSDAATGYWEADMVAGAFVRVEIPELRYAKTFRVPDDGTSALDVRDARPDPGPQGLNAYLASLPEQVGP